MNAPADATPSADSAPRPPRALLVAMALVGVESGALAAYSVAELFALRGSRVAMGVTTAVFFGFAALVLAACALSVVRRQSWARSPIVLAQLITLGLAWSFRGTIWVGLALAVLACGVLAGIFSRAALGWLDPSTSEA